MIRFNKTALTFLIVSIFYAVPSFCGFEFDIPTIPQVPVMEGITNSSAVAGTDSFTVSAKIYGVEQKNACCGPNCDRSDCDMDEWYMRPDPDIEPNPTCIPNANGHPDFADYDEACKVTGNPKVFYKAYPQAGGYVSGSVEMAFNADTGKFEASVPLTGLQEGDELTYYIIASDNRGNVVAQVPDPSTVPCTAVSSWSTDYETPSLNNCDFMNGYDLCNENQEGSPVCGSDYSINDPVGDTCGEPDSTGASEVVSGFDLTDILGVAAGAGKGFGDLPGQEVVCSRIGLMDAPPNTSEGVIDAYLMIFFNPDIPDPNPADIHMENAFAITYAPEAAGADPNLVKVLWDGDCVSDPDTPDVLVCKIFVGSDSETRLKIKYNNGDLIFIAVNDMGDGRTVVGGTSKASTMIMVTGSIQLSGGTPFWVNDLSVGLSMLKKNQTVTLGPPGNPAPPSPKTTVCQAGGEGDSPTCSQSTSQPASNECVLTITPSPDKSFTTYYNVYHSMTNVVSDATLIADISGATNFPENGSSNYTKSYSVTTLDGKPHYFFMSAVNAGSGDPLETPSSKWLSTSCTVEDWVPPSAPTGFSCSTPDGFESRCKCEWTADTSTDPSLYGFYLKRDGTLLNPTAAILSQSYTDSDESLENGSSYSYEVRAIDVGSNYSDWTTTSCTPEDFKPPSKVDTLGVVLQSGTIGVDLAWEPGSAEDLEKYNIYACEQSVTSPCGADSEGNAEGYFLVNDSTTITQPDPPETVTYSDNKSFGTEPGTWCFYVEACDNCKSSGACPSRSESNCSAFDTMANYRKCVYLTLIPETVAPLFPGNQAVEPLPEGKKCKLTWDMLCQDEDGTFGDCNYPEAKELMGYYIMRANAVGGNCSTTPVSSPSGGTPVGQAAISGEPKFTNEGLTNGTQYCYRVYGYDSANNFSRNEPIPSPISCTPEDIEAPDKPEIKVPVAFTNSTCTPEWDEVEDDDTVTYNVYRCEGTETYCNDSSKFTHLGSEQQLDSCEDTTDTQCEDWTLSPDTQYVYCLTAKDAKPNESDVYKSEDTVNCSPCMATSKCSQPTGVIGGEKGPNYFGFDAYWTKSSSDDGSGEGYSIYLCTGSTSDDCATTPLASGINGDYSATAYTVADAGVPSDGNYYIGISYEGADCGESSKAVSSNSVLLKTQDPCKDNSACTISIAVDGEFMKKEMTACESGDTDKNCQAVLAACSGSSVSGCTSAARKMVTSAAAGITVELFDSTTGSVVKSKTTLSDGSIPEFKENPDNVTTTDTFAIRMRLPAGYWNEMFAYAQSGGTGCEPDSGTGECVLVLASGLAIAANTTVDIDAVEIPVDSAMYGGQFANPDCDDKVTLKDLAAVKKRFFTDATQYHPAVDFNLDGKIDLKDLAMIKANFNKAIGAKGTDVSTVGGICDPEM